MYLNALHPCPLIRTITVNGEGSTTVPPNYALLQIEVTTDGSEVAETFFHATTMWMANRSLEVMK